MGEVGFMPRKGDIFKGKITDLSNWDKRGKRGWRRRDIWFFKYEINRRERFGYPTRSDRIVLIDTDGNRYELNFSKPEAEHKVCLGTPSKLKPWYQVKGFDYRIVDRNDCWVFFEYSGEVNEFFIFTEREHDLRYPQK